MMITEWDEIFDHWGIKKVSKTDKSKAAYVLTAAQLNAIKSAGYIPSESTQIDIKTPFSSIARSLTASFYLSERKTSEVKRSPEPRMGLALISTWLQPGDEVLIGNIGNTVYAIKISDIDFQSTDDVWVEIVQSSPREEVFAMAEKASRKPLKKITQRSIYARNLHVVAAALLRAGDECEMPKCTHRLFKRESGKVYLEVHHIVPLAENGHDSLKNVAALCPNCHREQHFGEHRKNLRDVLKSHIASKKLE